ncbi:mannosyltransferase [Tulasnella sp. 332]|nr:mannosyltransferase [Tulasnella sp. 332]
MSDATTPTAASRVQHVRFARPTNGSNETFANVTMKSIQEKPPMTNILQDQVRRFAKRPWCPNFSVALRLILLFRVTAAVYSNITDCDEVFNFWEPLHYLDQGSGFQTWETSPAYSIRSWAYIALHLLPARASRIFNLEKRQSFFAVRVALAFICSYAEAKFYRTIVERVSDRVGRYTFFFLCFSTGMWSASAAFLPSSFAMCCNMMALSYAFEPPNRLNNRRTTLAVMYFAIGAIVGWPFSLAVAIPFVLEEMFVYGNDHIKLVDRQTWMMGRWARLVQACLTASLIFLPVIALDSIAYGKLTVVPWNIIKYNVLNSDPSVGPQLYGTEPWYFYILNLILNFNVMVPLALASLPALLVTHQVDHKRLGIVPTPESNAPAVLSSSPYTLLLVRLAPLYLWLGILSLQPHKEERFMFPIYPLICFNAAVTLYLMRGWIEVAYIGITGAPYNASKSSIFSTFTRGVILLATILSVSRIFALSIYYHAPLDVVFNFQNTELPRLLNVTNLLILPKKSADYVSTSKYDNDVQIDLSALHTFGGIRLCVGKEWYRFPGHYLVPDGVDVEFIKSQFDGMLPGHFPDSHKTRGPWWWRRDQTKVASPGLNDRNEEEMSRYVDVSTCDYLVDSYFPLRQTAALEPNYVLDTATWDKVVCVPFLDGRNSGIVSRLFWFPTSLWQKAYGSGNNFGEYCMLRHKAHATLREGKTWTS